MFDAYIIERIRRQRESQRPARVPLRISVPRPPPMGHQPGDGEDPRDRDNQKPSRGVVIVDYSI